MKLDDYLTWINERLEINMREYNLTQSQIVHRRIRECIKMRDDFQHQHDELICRMSLDDSHKSLINQSHL